MRPFFMVASKQFFDEGSLYLTVKILVLMGYFIPKHY